MKILTLQATVCYVVVLLLIQICQAAVVENTGESLTQLVANTVIYGKGQGELKDKNRIMTEAGELIFEKKFHIPANGEKIIKDSKYAIAVHPKTKQIIVNFQ
eukprot:Pgem_evm1s14929